MDVKRLSMAAVLGGLTLFIWGAISHSPVIPFYNNALHKFTNEEALTQAILANTPRSGTYLIPNYPDYPPGASDEERAVLDEKMKRQMESGPFAIAHIRVGAMGSFGAHLVMELVTNILAAFVVTWLMMSAGPTLLRKRILFAMGIGLVVVLDHSASTWNWYSAGGDFFFAETFDAIVGWALAGAVIGKILGRKEKLPVM